MMKKAVNENFRDFINSAAVGGSGNRYEFGRNPSNSGSESVTDILNFISDISNVTMNVIENNNLSDSELDDMVYVKRQLEKARRDLVDAYRKIQDSVRSEY